MNQRQPTRSEDDLPVIGDYSEAHDARLRGSAEQGPATAPAATPRRPSAGQHRGQDDRLLIDPSDAHRHTRRLRQREHTGPVAKLLRYSPIALAAAVAFGVYWNFDRLREIRVTFTPLSNFTGSTPAATNSDSARFGAELPTESVEAPVIVNPDALGGDAEAPLDPEARTVSAPVEVLPVAASRELPARAAEAGAPAADVALAVSVEREPAPASPPPPPPEPETFVFGLPTHTVSESDAAVAVLILRNGGDGSESSVTWWTTPGTATPDVDYVDLGMVTERFPRGAQNRTIRIPIVGDSLVEGPETFYIHLAPSEGTSVPPERLRTEVVIVDDD